MPGALKEKLMSPPSPAPPSARPSKPKSPASHRRHQRQPRPARQTRRIQGDLPSGGGVAAGSLGLPDLGINNPTTCSPMCGASPTCDLPLMVDIDTGFGPSAFNIARNSEIADQIRRGRLPH